MKKNIYKIGVKTFFMLMTLTLTLTLSSCFERETGQQVDENKTQLYIGLYDGDLGSEWLKEVIAKYEAKNPDVQIILNLEKDLYGDANLLTNMPSYTNDLYFLNGNTYSNYIAQGRLLEITDVVTSKIDGENKTIEDKMNDSIQKRYKLSDGKYYAVPFFDAIFGTMYDVDLFEQEGFYFNTDGVLLCDSNNKTLSAGPNGITGDYDDGLPATISQWKEMVNTMSISGITPYTWTGMYQYYRQRFLTSIWADYEGKENFDLNMSLNGKYTFAGDSVPTDITLQNGYLLQNQKGKEYALEMAKYIIENGYYTSDSFDSVNTHQMAQQNYLLSAVNTKSNRIAMILEGGWWESGAKEFFKTMASRYGEEYAYGVRRFGFMPTPKADDGSSASGTTLISSTGNSFICISSQSQQVELAKDFLKFVHSDESLRTFTRVTGSVRPYDYTLTEEDKNAMTYFSNMMFDIYHAETTEISYITLFNNDVFVKEPSYLSNTNWFWGANINNQVYTDPFYEFSQDSSLTVSQYTKGMKEKYSKEAWDITMSKYYG